MPSTRNFCRLISCELSVAPLCHHLSQFAPLYSFLCLSPLDLSPFALKSIITIVSINDIPFVTISYYHYTNCYMSTATDFIDVIRARKKV